MNRPLTRWRFVSLGVLSVSMGGCLSLPGQHTTPSSVQGQAATTRDEMRAAEAGNFSVDLALGVPTVRKTQGLAADLGIGKVVAGLFDFGSAANEVARLGWLTSGSYQSAGSNSPLQAASFAWFAAPHAAPISAIVGTPTKFGSTRHSTNSLANFGYLDLYNSNRFRLEPRRYMVRDFGDGESLLQNGNAAAYIRFGNLAADDGSGAHRYLAFAVAWDGHPDPTQRKVLGYTDAIVDPASASSPVPLNLVLNEGVSTDRTQIGVTLDPVVPAIEDCPAGGCQGAQP